MKKILSALVCVAMIFSMCVNAFAVTTVTGNVFTRDETGNPSKTASGVSDTNTSYEFKSSTGFYYTVIPDNIKIGEDDKKQYMLVSNTYYGKLPDYDKLEVKQFLFDPDIKNGIAYWLNNDFLNDTAAASHDDCTGASLDTSVKNYLVASDWYVEGINSDKHGTDYKYDFYVNCKVALLSTRDFVNYGKYMKQSLKFANGTSVPSKQTYSCMLRTPGLLETSNVNSHIKRYVQSSGNTGGCAVSFCGIRPCFYVTEDYFKENKISEYGSKITEIIKEHNTKESLESLGYSEDEIGVILTDTTLTVDAIILTGNNSYPGSVVKADFTYSDGVQERCDSEKTIIRWYSSLTSDGKYVEIENSQGSEYTLQGTDGGKYLKASVTLVGLDGLRGVEKMSDGYIKVLSHLNTITPSIQSSTSPFSTNEGQVAKNNAAYDFTYTDENNNLYTYSLINTVKKDGEDLFLLYSKDQYGDVSKITSVVHINNVFNPDDKNNIAYWLNNAFYNGEEVGGGSYNSFFDQKAKEYIAEYNWVVEGNGMGDNHLYKTTPVTQTDYTAMCKIALLSVSEYANYASKIGYASTSSIASSGDRVLLRSPNTSTSIQMKFFGSGSGNLSHQQIANELNSDGTVKKEGSFENTSNPVVVRPCFYVTKDYFANVKIDSVGEEVKKIIRQTIPKSELLNKVYTENELVEVLGYAQNSAVLNDVSITGKIAQGEMLSVMLDIDNTDENTDIKYIWYASENESDIGVQIYEGKHYTVSSAITGKYLTLIVDISDKSTLEKIASETHKLGKVETEKGIHAIASTEFSDVDGEKQITFVVTNKTGDYTKKVKLLIAAFDKNNTMLKNVSNITEKTLESETNIFDDIKVPSADDAAFYRVMVWTSDGNKPLCCITIE